MNQWIDPTWVRSLPRFNFEHQVGHEDPNGRPDVLNRVAKGLWATLLRLIATTHPSIEVNAASPTATAPSVTPDFPQYLLNTSGITYAAGDVVALDTDSDRAVLVDHSAGSLRCILVALEAVPHGSRGRFARGPSVTCQMAGAVTAGQYLRKSATPQALEQTASAANETTPLPAGTVGIALETTGGAGLARALLFAAPVAAVGAPVAASDSISGNSTPWASNPLGATLTLTTGARRVLLLFHGWTGLFAGTFTVLVDDVDIAPDADGFAIGTGCVSGVAISPRLTAGAHTFKLWKTAGGADLKWGSFVAVELVP